MRRLLIPLLFLAALAAGYAYAANYDLGSFVYSATVVFEKVTPIQEGKSYPATVILGQARPDQRSSIVRPGVLLEYFPPGRRGLEYTAGYTLLVNGMEATVLPPGYYQNPAPTVTQTVTQTVTNTVTQTITRTVGQTTTVTTGVPQAPTTIQVGEGPGVPLWALAAPAAVLVILLFLGMRR